jgi:hypothetical protein
MAHRPAGAVFKIKAGAAALDHAALYEIAYRARGDAKVAGEYRGADDIGF